MKYRELGRTGFEVSEMAHGLWGMSGWSGSDDRESLDALQLATDLGCNFMFGTTAGPTSLNFAARSKSSSGMESSVTSVSA